jgi:hypothetical protein
MGIGLKNSWTRDWLASLLGQEETTTLEFKSSRALSSASQKEIDAFFDNQLSQAVSAFINTEGGILVVGLEEEKNANRQGVAGKASELSAGVPRHVMDANRFSNKLLDRIHPATGSFVKVHIVKVGTNDHGDLLAFVVEIQPGVTAYQAADKKYYCRRAFSNVPMDDKDIRLRMLTDDRPRATIELADPVFKLNGIYSVDTLRSAVVEYRKRRERMLMLSDEQRQARIAAAIASGDIRVPEWQFLRDKPVLVSVGISINNTGNVTITRGASRLEVFLASDSLGRDCYTVAKTTEPFLFESSRNEIKTLPEDEIPLYPGMRRQVRVFTFNFKRFTDLKSISDLGKITIYLDGGSPAELQFGIGTEFGNAYGAFERDVLAISEEFKSDIEQLL